MPSGVVPHHQPCLLVWFLTIDHACLRGTSLKAMPSGSIAFASRLQMEGEWLQDWFYLYIGAIISDKSDDPMPLSAMSACKMQLYQTNMLGS